MAVIIMMAMVTIVIIMVMVVIMVMAILMPMLTIGKTEMMIIDQNGEVDENLGVFRHGKLPLLQRVLQLLGLQLQLLLGLTQVPGGGDDQDDQDGG